MAGYQAITRFSNSNLAATHLDNTQGQELIGMQSGPAPWDWATFTDVRPAEAGKISITIPNAVELPELTMQGQELNFSTVGMGSYDLVTHSFSRGLSIGRDMFDALGPVQDILTPLLKSLGSYGEQHLANLAVQALYNLGTEVRTNFDGLTYFNTAHPVDPNNPAQKSFTTGATTWGNQFVLMFTLQNLIKAITVAMLTPLENGQNAPIKRITVGVPMPLIPQARQYIQTLGSPAINYGGVFSAESIVGADRSITEAARECFGIEIDMVPLFNYPVSMSGTTLSSYSWFLFTNLERPFNCRYQYLHQFNELTSDTDYNMFIRQEKLFSIRANLVVAGSITPRGIYKFTSS